MKVSVIIPCYNEEKYIRKCLESVLNQTYDDIVEILVVDGKSTDKTKQVATEFSDNVLVLENKKKIFASACNIGIKNAKGEVIVILGCHAFYPSDYVEKCVKYLVEYGADNIGGVITPTASSSKLIARAIALSLSSPFGTGKIESKKVKEADTVFGGCYRREVFDKIGFFNEDLARSSDMDLNLRLIGKGGKIIKAPDIKAYYYSDDNLKDFFLHNIKDGIWAIIPFKITQKPLKLRHYIPLLFMLFLPIIVIPYVFVSLIVSLFVALKERNALFFILMPAIFLVRHIGYGLGSVIGVFKILLNKNYV